MATTILETLGTVRPDGTLVLDEKVTVPPGRVKVRVESMETHVQPSTGSTDPSEGKSPSGTRFEGTMPPPSHEVEKHFRALVRKWKEETGHLSSAARMAKHPAYQAIILMGQPVVPLLLAELRRDPDFWFAALRAITGENPVLPASAGKVKEMARAWIEWGKNPATLAGG